MRIRSHGGLLLVLGLLCLLLQTQQAEARFLWWGQPDKLPRRLQEDMRKLAGDSLALRLHVLRGDGRELASFDGHKATAPASLAKLLTCAAALECLPDSLPFRTALSLRPDSLRTHLALSVSCGGNPDLGDSLLDHEVRKLLAAWPDSLPVQAVIHTGRFDRRGLGPGWMWDDGDGRWAARVGAATINGNCVIHRLEAGRPGQLIPRLVGAAEERIRVQAGLRRPRRDWQEGRDHFRVPFWAATPPLECSVAYPDSLYARLLNTGIRKAGHEPVDFPRITRLSADTLDHILPGLSLHALIDSVLHASWNLGAECLFQECEARADSLGQATWEGAARRQKQVLGELAASVSGQLPEWRVVDGSGMSRYNAAPMSLFTELLLMDHEARGGALASHLPAPGQGTLKGRFAGLPEGIVFRAKTGSLSGRRLIAGVLFREEDPRNRLYVACCLEGYLGPSAPILRVQEELLGSLADWLEDW